MSVARAHDLRPARHGHGFADAGRDGRARALGAVALLTLATMAVELVAGWWSGSLALTADGWHMGTHALAIGGAWLAARWAARVEARAHAAGDEGRYSFGGWKIEVLAAYTSGLSLLAVALWLVVDAVLRLLSPEPVAFGPALVVAVIGLVVNLVSAAMLMRANLAIDPELVLNGQFEPALSWRLMAELLARRRDFDGVLAADYQMALAALRALREAGVRVPDAVQVAGFGDGEEAAGAGLTTVAADVYEQGRRGARQLIGQMEGLRMRGTTVLNTSLIPRDTTRPCRVEEVR